ncbi:MAG: LytTR family DNA-binding domain-containing protein [Wujia sp.]|nr:LytTR family DNA-binding domain-containing protein [Wujia sp.]MDD7282643.1 LytTR family DNA-binding domain-containing protein [Clostridium sp.]MDY3728190.1 LytTR family DNA-binding domain-containing protein [Wujia sp.]
MTIIMCDDDRNDLRMLRANVERFGEKHAVDLSIIELNELRNVAQIEALLEKQEVDAVFLDIDMPYISGDDVAEALVGKYPNLCIIFFTNREEMVFDVIRFKPYRFIKKQDTAKIEDVMNTLVQRSEQEGHILIEKGKAELVKVHVREILYIEAVNHQIVYHMQEEQIISRGSIAKLAKEFGKFGFVRAHMGCLVNIRHIKYVDKKNIQMNDGTCIVLGGKYKEDLMKNYKIMLEQIRYGR